MKYAVLVTLLFLTVSTAFAQQPATRRGLDQIDLLSMPRSTQASDAGPAVNVDLDTFQLLEPLVRYCREMERDYKTTVIDGNKALTAETFSEVFNRKAEAVQRSLFLIGKIKEMPPQVAALLQETDQYGRDLALIAVSLYEESGKPEGDVARVSRKYGMGDQPDKKLLVAAILRRLNANFARVKVAG